MRKFNMHEAKANFSGLVRLALEGEEVVIICRGTPLVRLVPVRPAEGLRPIGLGALLKEEITADFEYESLRPLSRAELAEWHTPLERDDL